MLIPAATDLISFLLSSHPVRCAGGRDLIEILCPERVGRWRCSWGEMTPTSFDPTLDVGWKCCLVNLKHLIILMAEQQIPYIYDNDHVLVCQPIFSYSSNQCLIVMSMWSFPTIKDYEHMLYELWVQHFVATSSNFICIRRWRGGRTSYGCTCLGKHPQCFVQRIRADSKERLESILRTGVCFLILP